MSGQEMQMELNLMQQRIAVDQQSMVSLRAQLTKAHVVNMNGIEGMGGGREWESRATGPAMR